MNDVIMEREPNVPMIKEWNGQRVVTFRDIDEAHGRTKGTARKNFQNNKKHFAIGEDYFILTREDPIGNIFHIGNIPPKGVTVLTESGYLMVVKSFTDDLSWDVQRRLVKSYFRQKSENAPQPEFELFTKCGQVPLPKYADWYTRSQERFARICRRFGITQKKLLHLILTKLGQEYNLRAINKRYEQELGYPPKYAIDIINYYGELEAAADRILDWMEKF